MPSPEENFRVRHAVLWKASGHNSHGEVTLDSPKQITLRWDQTKAEAKGADDRSESANVSSAQVGEQIPIGSILWEGKLMHYDSTGTANLYLQVTSYSEVWDVKGRKATRTVELMHYGSVIPELTS